MLKSSMYIARSPSDLFDLSQDYSTRLKWDSFLIEARVLGAQAPGVGVRTFCRAWNGIGIETEYVSFEPGRVVAIKMTKAPWFFKEFAATWSFKPMENGTTLTFIYHFRTRWVPQWIMGWVLSRELKRRLSDLKRFAESRP